MFDVWYLLTICLKGKEGAVGGEREEGIKVSMLENKGLFSCCLEDNTGDPRLFAQ